MKLVLFLLSACAALSVLATPHFHPARRHPIPIPLQRRRCRDRSSSSGGVPTAINPIPSTPTSSEGVPTAKALLNPIPSTPTSLSPSTTTITSPTPTTTQSGDVNFDHTGDGTFFNPGLGSCGFKNTDDDAIVAVSHEVYDTYPGYNGVNPNTNPICGKKILASFEGKTVTVTVVDRCADATCLPGNLDFSVSAFKQLADVNRGRILGVKWHLFD